MRESGSQEEANEYGVTDSRVHLYEPFNVVLEICLIDSILTL